MAVQGIGRVSFTKVSDGRGVSSIVRWFGLSNSDVTEPRTYDTTAKVATARERFVWAYDRITYDDGTTTETTHMVVSIYAGGDAELVFNGDASLGDNTNFPALQYDGENPSGAGGSFTRPPGQYGTVFSTEKVPINKDNPDYIFSFDAKSTLSQAIMYSQVEFFDIDDNRIFYPNVAFLPATTTTLAHDLKNGDTTVYLDDLRNWKVQPFYVASSGFIVWNYRDSTGHVYSPETYSRNIYNNLYTSSDAVDKVRGTISLSSPWNKGFIPAGTKLSQCVAGGVFYNGVIGKPLATQWTHYEGEYKGWGRTSNRTTPWGAAYMKIGFLWNYGNTSRDDQIWVANISLKHVTKGEDGVNGVPGAPGKDAETWELSVVKESAVVKRVQTNTYPVAFGDKLEIDLQYQIQHKKGDVSEVVPASASGYNIKVRGNNGIPAQTAFPMGSQPSYKETIAYDKISKDSRPTQFIVELFKGTTPVETKIVPVTLEPASWIEQAATHLSLTNQQAEQIAQIILDATGITQRVETLRNGVRNLIDGELNRTFSNYLFFGSGREVTLKPNKQYTMTVKGSVPFNGNSATKLAVYIRSTDNTWYHECLILGFDQIAHVTFTTDEDFPVDGKVYINASRTFGSVNGNYKVEWITLTEGSVPASDYFSDVETRLSNGDFTIDAKTIVKRMLFATKALIGSAVFFDRFMFSKYGTGTGASDPETDYEQFNKDNPFDSEVWKPNLAIDFLNGILMASQGKVKFNTDGSGHLAGGNISWDADGDTDIKGVVRASTFYGMTHNFRTEGFNPSGTPYYEIDLGKNIATTYVVQLAAGRYARLPKASDFNGLEITLILDDTDSYYPSSEVKTREDESFLYYGVRSGAVGAETFWFSSIKGKGWMKIQSTFINGRWKWLITGCGGYLRTNHSSGYNYQFGNGLITNI